MDAEVLPVPPGGLTLEQTKGTTAETIAEADRRARYWRSPGTGPLTPGSDAHKRACAAMFRDTFNPYKPTIIDWPKLPPEARDRLINLPIWDIAVQTEGRARIRMLTYALSVADPDWRGALELNAWEEGRHKTVLSNLVEAYGITLEPEPAYPAPKNKEWAYLVTGFSECVDSFFAFGLFALAERSGFFPPELVGTFEPVMQEECRHILLFANWLAWHRARMPWWRRPWFELKVRAVWLFLGWERIGLARGMDAGGGKPPVNPQDNNFTLNGSKAVADVDVKLVDLLALCLEENDRRFANYDHRLKRPWFVPTMARLAVRLLGGRKKAGG